MTAANSPRVNSWDRALSVARPLLGLALSIAALAAPILTGAYYLVLASGSATAARQMMLVSNPVDMALALTLAFFPAVAAAAISLGLVATRISVSMLMAY